MIGTYVADPRATVLHALVRGSTDALFRVSPDAVADPRGLILDPLPDGRWALRVRAGNGHWCLIPDSNAWLEGQNVDWQPLDPARDLSLPGRTLLTNRANLAAACHLDRILATTIVQYRAGRRAVVRVQGIRDGVSAVLYAKLLRSKRAATAARVFESLSRSGVDVFVTPRTFDSKRAAFVFDEVDGPVLHDALWGEEPVPVSRLAACLRAFAACPPLGLPLVQTDLRESALGQLEKGIRLLPELETLAARIACSPGIIDQLRSRSDGAAEADGIVHGDLHDKQIFRTRDGIRFIDCEGVRAGRPMWDWVNLLEHLRLRGLQGAAQGIGTAEALERRLDLEPRVANGLHVERALIRARLAGVYALRPWWWGVSMQLMREATRALDTWERAR